jgi:hypothetical protein
VPPRPDKKEEAGHFKGVPAWQDSWDGAVPSLSAEYRMHIYICIYMPAVYGL